jgi:hypothetical protein
MSDSEEEAESSVGEVGASHVAEKEKKTVEVIWDDDKIERVSSTPTSPLSLLLR